MKLLSFETQGEVHAGAAISEGVFDLTRALGATHPQVSQRQSLLAIIQSGIDIAAIGEASIQQIRAAGTPAEYLVADPRWLPPILRPPKILALALNFREHIEIMLAYCSDYSPMEAGDVLSLGTFAGKKTLEAGDELELEIEKIGVLRNRVVAAREPWPSFTSEKPIGPLVREPLNV